MEGVETVTPVTSIAEPEHPAIWRPRPMAVHSLEDRRDGDLIRQVGVGNEEAFRELFRRYAPLGKALALRVLQQSSLAEDIVQEVFLAIWQRAGSYREDRGSVRSWFLSMVHHRAVDLVRREEAQRRRVKEQEAAFEVVDVSDAADAGAMVVEALDLGDRRRSVRAVLDELPQEQRDVLKAMYYEGKTQATIAEETGIPLGTVKSRTLLAMRRLRRALSTEDG
jgi:RNA polymerase sigma-70 factor, ECF subfamily